MPKNPIDYSKTVIYKIECKDLTKCSDVYVGHTVNFIKREYNHKNKCTNSKSKHYNLQVYTIIRANGGWDNWIMIEIEKYPCNDKKQAIERERYWYNQLNAKLNSDVPNRSIKEWLEENKDEQIKKRKKYYEKNKNRISKRDKEYYKANEDKLKKNFDCECGGMYKQYTKSKHLKTKKHQAYLESLPNTDSHST